jgi:hypothetical protein
MKSKKFTLTTYQKEVLIGTLLGDAHLEKQKGAINYRLKFQQSVLHHNYILHLYDIFKDIVATPPKLRTRVGFGKKQGTWYFNTLACPDFLHYGELFYKDNKKVIPTSIKELLTPVGLAFWYMDDGGLKSNQSKGVFLHTHGYSSEEVHFLCDVLTDKFNLSCWPRFQKDGVQIYISGKSYETLRELIYPHLIVDMHYKFPSERKRRISL